MLTVSLPLRLLAAVAFTAGLSALATPVLPARADAGDVVISVLSNRADLVSDGDALVEVRVPASARTKELRIFLGSRDITGVFDRSQRSRARGLVTGLRNGQNVLEARLSDGQGARLTITNHSKGGPVFAGPQVPDWTCTTAENGLGQPTDAACNAPTKISYMYQPRGASAGSYKAYDPGNPPSDVATTRTDEGKTVPYIIRVEEGTLDRSIYKVMVLADPAKPWTATTPQPAWDRKLLVAFGGGCGTMHLQNPPTQAGLAFPFGPVEYAFGDSASDGEIQQPAVLSRGWMTAGTGLNTLNFNCNEVVSAEALMMLKEHIVDRYGTVRRTISVGGSGGSLQQYNIASAYPGLLDGIVPTQSFPDLWAMTGDTADCYLGDHYFTSVSPQLWSDQQQQLAVEGKSGPLSCGEFVGTFADWFDPQNRGVFHAGAAVRFGCELPPTDTYEPVVNPTGVRCSVQDYQRAIWGHSGPRDAAPLPIDNTGVQYGLTALRRGRISPAQFVDLNAGIGGIDNEGEFIPRRASMSDRTAGTMYRADRTTDAHRLAQVPIIDVRQFVDASDPETKSDMHQPFYTAVMRARLRAANGTDANMVRWSGVPQNMDMDGVLAMDRWLQAVAADHSDLPRSQKIIRDRPKGVTSTCWIDGSPVTDTARCAKQYPPPVNGGDARIAAGGPLTDNVRKCHLKPLRRGDYNVAFTDPQWQQLQAAFPDGVCDWARPSVGEQRSLPWVTFARGPGGQPLGAPPVSVPFGPAASTAAPGAPPEELPTTGGGTLTPWALALLLCAAALARTYPSASRTAASSVGARGSSPSGRMRRGT